VRGHPFLLFFPIVAVGKSPVRAAINYYETTSPLSLAPPASSYQPWNANYFTGAYVSDNGINVETSSVAMRLGFDTDNLRMWVDRLTFNLVVSPKTMTAQIADVNGNSKTITTKVQINPISITANADLNNSWTYKKLTAGTGGAYGLVDQYSNFSVNPQSQPITGSYTTTGPSQNWAGLFSSVNSSQWTGISLSLGLPDFINLSKPGEKVIFSKGISTTPLYVGLNFSMPAVYSVVDDVNLAVGLSFSGSYQLDNALFTLVAIPEPSALSLLAVGLCGLAIVRCRRS